MSPEDIDDLFRAQLDGHATPPSDALWARLQADAHAEPAATQPTAGSDHLDQLFQKGLHGHITPPDRALWERLEDEHLRPRQRRPAGWWPMALVAAVALLLVAGGAGLWLGFPGSNTQTGTVASSTHHRQKPAIQTPKKGVLSMDSAATQAARATAVVPRAIPDSPTIATISGNDNTANRRPQQFSTTEATRPAALASTAPKAHKTAFSQLANHPLGTNRQPDAAADHCPLVARTTARHPTRPALNLPLPPAANELRPTINPTINPNTAVALSPKPALVPEIVAASPVPAPVLASSTRELITVDVHSGANPPARPTQTFNSAMAQALTEAPDERRGLGSRLLQQAGHLVRGERLSLAEATGLPENMTLRATIAGRSISKSIQL